MRRTAPVPTVNASASLLEDFSNGSAVRRSFICAANAKNIQTMNVQTGLDRSLNGQKREVMSSLQIADVTGRNHKEVMRSIRTMEPAWVKVNGRSFALVNYTDAKGEKRPCYQLTKTECLYIATKFNDEARARLVLRWEELENQQRMEQSRELTTRIANLKKYNIFALDYYNIYSWAKSTKFFEQDKMGAHYGGGLETVRSHKRPAYVVIVTPTVGFFFHHNSYRYDYE